MKSIARNIYYTTGHRSPNNGGVPEKPPLVRQPEI